MAKIRCQKCRGQKEFAGIGGIMKRCDMCNATGLVEQVVKKAPEVVKVNHIEEALEKVSAAEVVASAAIDNSPKQTLPKRKSRARAKVVEPVAVVAEVAAPVIDEFTQAILDEPKMTPEAWQAKYRHIDRLFGIDKTGSFGALVSHAQRAAIRANYAATQYRAPRTVDLQAAQDSAVATDLEYAAYVANEKRMIEAAEAKKASK